MQKYIPLAFLMLIALNQLKAQSLWVQNGVSYASALYKYENRDLLDDETFKPRFHFGINAELPVTSGFSVIPGVVLQTKGFYETFKRYDPEIRHGREFKLFYLDAPVLLNIKIPFKKSVMFIETGPYAGVGLSGSLKGYEDIHEPYTEKEQIHWGKEKDAILKRMEYGIMGGAGAEINRFKFGFSYTHSMRNISIPDDFTYKNRVLSLFVSYAVLKNRNK
jgi:hypothetical protein